MSAAYGSHRTSYVWLRQGSSGVIGFTLEDLNESIDRYNKSNRWMDFWDFLSLDSGYTVTGFSALWNDGNPLMSQVHIIKAVNN